MSDDSGKIMKKFKMINSEKGDGMFISLNVNDKSNPKSPISSSMSIPISWGEYIVIESLIKYSLPKMLGFDKIWDETTTPFSQFNAPNPPSAPIYKKFE